MLPTGNSAGAAKNLASVSAKTQKMAPKRREKVKLIRLSFPNIRRAIWGMINPTNPTTPQKATVTAINREDRESTINLTFWVFIPLVRAISSPNCMIFNDLE